MSFQSSKGSKGSKSSKGFSSKASPIWVPKSKPRFICLLSNRGPHRKPRFYLFAKNRGLHNKPRLCLFVMGRVKAEVRVAFNDRAERYHSRNLVTERELQGLCPLLLKPPHVLNR